MLKGGLKILKHFNVILNYASLDIDYVLPEDTYNILKNLTNYAIANIIKDYKNYNYLINKDLELSLILTNDNNIKDLNYKWQNRLSPTNVLSMSMFDKEDARLSNLVLLGDIVISIETAEREAISYNISSKFHIIRLFLHGVLHIFGFDHETDEQTIIMEQFENKILQNLNSDLKGLTSNYWK